jgi:hypothetical protein
VSTIQFSVRRRDLAWATALVVLLSAVWVARGDQADAGVTPPPGTGIAVVYIAVGTNFPDALGVGPGGGVNGAPIIIVPTNPPIPAATSAELVRLDPRTVIIIGGTAAVSAAMETALGTLLPSATITRISGASRYETNAAFSQATFPVEGWASIPAAAFTTTHPETDSSIIGLNGAYTATGLLHAPIQLPHGAEILELKVTCYDNDEVQNLSANLYSIDELTQIWLVATVATSGAPNNTSPSSTAITAGFEIVDNENYAYVIGVADADGFPYLISVQVRYRLGASTG